MWHKFIQWIGLNPPKIISFKSDYSPVLEVYKFNGKWILDSYQANYSYGSLMRAFEFAFQQIPIKNFKPHNILLLGLGAGCILEILENYFDTNTYSVDGIEIDPVVIQIGYQYFNIHRFSNLNIIHQDAQSFVKNSNKKYDFIIVDLFIDLKVPDFLFEKNFLNKLQWMLTEKGKLLINTIPNIQDNQLIIKELEKNGNLMILERYKQINEMIYWEKQNN